ncbi:uncharacterized protein SCHCODRAFT_02501241 [Schizophyllum commune H4-8]|nr:uncharacterized protein SCHCODRAFT_02501241 [Schizophyllum commune H4-8]KAI5894120.1 hypothetical protein SCHCODRAFT_02501241 [Schizophyllum commune H4-8]
MSTCLLKVSEDDIFNTVLFVFKHDRAYDIRTTVDEQGARTVSIVCRAGEKESLGRIDWREKAFMVYGIEVPWRCSKRKESTLGSSRNWRWGKKEYLVTGDGKRTVNAIDVKDDSVAGTYAPPQRHLFRQNESARIETAYTAYDEQTVFLLLVILHNLSKR